jgi:hypothetical protein
MPNYYPLRPLSKNKNKELRKRESEDGERE